MTVTTILRGGIGNCLFCIATVLAYSMKHDCDYCIPTVIDNPHYKGQTVFYSPKIKYADIEVNKVERLETYTEPFFHYQEIPKYDCDVLILNGYFQSSLFFNEYRKEILKILDIPVLEFKPNKIFIHYRLGDYKILGKFHKIISDEYIEDSILFFKHKGFYDFVVLSDEIDIAKEKINSNKYQFKYLNFEYSEGRTEIEDLYLMASCEGGIMSASSFSWWGAYLGNQNRTIIYPKNWFSEGLSYNDVKDLCPKHWIAI